MFHQVPRSLKSPLHAGFFISQFITSTPNPATSTRIYEPQNTKKAFMAHLLAGQLRHYSYPFCLLILCEKPHRKQVYGILPGSAPTGLFIFYLWPLPIRAHSFFAEDQFSGVPILSQLNLPSQRRSPPLKSIP